MQVLLFQSLGLASQRLIANIHVVTQRIWLQLNSKPLRPHTVCKTTTIDSLMTTPLQLAAHTQLLLDATLMQAGQLERRGIYNLQVLP